MLDNIKPSLVSKLKEARLYNSKQLNYSTIFFCVVVVAVIMSKKVMCIEHYITQSHQFIF